MDAAGEHRGDARAGARLRARRRAAAKRQARAARARRRACGEGARALWRGRDERAGARPRLRARNADAAGRSADGPQAPVLRPRNPDHPRRSRLGRRRHRRRAHGARPRRRRLRGRPEIWIGGQVLGGRAESGRRQRRLSAVDADLRRPVHLEGERHDHRAAARARCAARRREDHAQLSALLAPQDAGRVPHHAAVVHRHGTGRPARGRAEVDPRRRRLVSGMGRGTHRRHGRGPTRLVHLAPAHLGRADRALRRQGKSRSRIRAASS